jgi:ATP-binding cassette subfamily B protein
VKGKLKSGAFINWFKAQIGIWKYLPRLFKMVWETSPLLFLANIFLRVSKSVSPLLILYVGRLIIDQVVLLKGHSGVLISSYLWKLILVEVCLVVFSDFLGKMIILVDGLSNDLFVTHSAAKIMIHADSLDLDQFEDAELYDKIELSRSQSINRAVLVTAISTQIQELITVGLLITSLIVFNSWLILLLISTVLPLFFEELYFNKKTYHLVRSRSSLRREMEYLFNLGGSSSTAKELKIYGLSAFIVGKFKALAGSYHKESRMLLFNHSIWGGLLTILSSLGYYGAYVVIIDRTIKGNISIGELTFLAGSFKQLRGLLENIFSRFTQIAQGVAYLKDFFELFELKARIRNVVNSIAFPRPIKTGFLFENVGFKYSNSERWANRHLNFSVLPGEKIALVGENGSGKTTLIKLLLRLYDPTEGKILLDGQDLKEYDIDDLRRNMGVIFQDFLRYQMSFSHNIAAGNITESGNMELIRHSAIQSMAAEFVHKLPNGYDQVLGSLFPHGVELSGGEWQKVAIARAYMRDSSLLVLDEPTSALDAKSEYALFQRFVELTHGRAAILISHRFSTVRMADRIMVMVNGEIEEVGSHDELLLNDSIYAELFNLQAQGYK